jgi:four helix bundle protein
MLYFERLIVWQKAMNLAVVLVQVADSLPTKYQYSFSDQLRRAALSIASNIAEGSGRKSKRDSANFYSISKGSAYESVNIIILLDKLNLLDRKRFSLEDMESKSEEVAKMLYGLSK